MATSDVRLLSYDSFINIKFLMYKNYLLTSFCRQIFHYHKKLSRGVTYYCLRARKRDMIRRRKER